MPIGGLLANLLPILARQAQAQGSRTAGLSYAYPRRPPFARGPASNFPQRALGPGQPMRALPRGGGPLGAMGAVGAATADPAAAAMADAVAAQGATAAGGGAASRLWRQTPARPTGMGIGRMVSRGVGRGLGGAVAGELGAGVAGAVVPGEDSDLERTLEGAARGAGVGAGIGAIGLPIPVLGQLTTAGGALAGGAVGGLLGLFGGGKKGGGKAQQKAPTTRQQLSRALGVSGLDPDRQRYIKSVFESQAALGGNTKPAAIKALQQASALISTEMADQRRDREQNSRFGGMGMGGADPTYLAALQAEAAKFIAPYAASTRRSASLEAETMRQLLPSLPENFRPIVAAGIAGELGASSRLADAYAAQALGAPIMAAVDYQRGLLNQIAQQIMSQGIGYAMNPPEDELTAGGAGGSGDLTALLEAAGVGA